jgi:4-amino-4-deoxy-L-arabinose transferase-like glycosyltransferase
MRVLGWIAAGAAILWLPMSFPIPGDQGLFSWAGDVIVRGGMPYVDAWDMKGPVVYYVYAAAQKAFGVHLWTIRIVDAALLITAAVFVRRAAIALTDRVTGTWAALIFFLWYASQSYWHTAQPDGWTGMILIIALAPVIGRTTSVTPVQAAWVGVCIGLVTLFKPLWVMFLLLPATHVVVARNSRRIALFHAIGAGPRRSRSRSPGFPTRAPLTS